MISASRTALVLAALAGVLIGVCAGVFLAWAVWPTTDYTSEPAQLRRDYVADYIVLIAGQYWHDGDRAAAQTRVAGLGLTDPKAAMLQVTHHYRTQGGDLNTVRALARLAHDLGASDSALVVFLQTATPTPTPTFTPTPTPAPSATPTPTPTITATPEPTGTATPLPTFKLTDRRRICLDEAGAGRIEIYVQDAAGIGIPYVEVTLASDEGEERFYTGLKLGRAAGLADYALPAEARTYRVRVPHLDEPAGDLTSDPSEAGCPASSGSVVWQLTFTGNLR